MGLGDAAEPDAEVLRLCCQLACLSWLSLRRDGTFYIGHIQIACHSCRQIDYQEGRWARPLPHDFRRCGDPHVLRCIWSVVAGPDEALPCHRATGTPILGIQICLARRSYVQSSNTRVYTPSAPPVGMREGVAVLCSQRPLDRQRRRGRKQGCLVRARLPTVRQWWCLVVAQSSPRAFLCTWPSEREPCCFAALKVCNMGFMHCKSFLIPVRRLSRSCTRSRMVRIDS